MFSAAADAVAAMNVSVHTGYGFARFFSARLCDCRRDQDRSDSSATSPLSGAEQESAQNLTHHFQLAQSGLHECDVFATVKCSSEA
jgi:hypothetical protein